MARNMYGATSADFTLTSGGRVVPGATLTIWSARTGGSQITDLLDVDSVACTTVTSAPDGSVVYYGPDGDKDPHWADSGQGNRIAIRPVDITGEPPVFSIGTVDTGTADASLTGTSEEPVLNLTIPAVGDGAIHPEMFGDDTKPGNLLTQNQASGGDTLGNTTGFKTNGVSSFARDTTNAFQGTGSIQATRTGAGTCGAIVGGAGDYFANPNTLPVIPGQSYTATATVRSSDSTEDCSLRVKFYTSGGAAVGSAIYNPSVPLTTNWYTHTLVVVCPPTAAFVVVWVEKTQVSAGTETWNIDACGLWSGVGGSWRAPGVPIPGASGKVAIRPRTATYHILEDKDAGQILRFDTSVATTVVVPAYSTTAYPPGTVIQILQAGTGAVTVSQAAGVTVNANPGKHIAGQWSLATLICLGRDSWVVVGDLSAT